MGDATVRLGVGSSVLLDGQTWTVEAFEGSRVLLGDGSDFRPRTGGKAPVQHRPQPALHPALNHP